MLKEIFRRLFIVILWTWVIITVQFFLVRLAPSSPFSARQDDQMGGAAAVNVERLEKQFGLDQPLYIQYFKYCQKCIKTRSFGTSYYRSNYTLLSVFKTSNALRKTLQLVILSMTFGLSMAIALGIFCGIFSSSSWSAALHCLLGIIASLPIYILQPMVIHLLVIRLKWFPSGGWGNNVWGDFSHLFLPVALQSIKICADLTRYVEESLHNVLSSSYIRAAVAKGLPFRKIIFFHALKPTLLPLIHLFFLQFLQVFLGSVYLEGSFSIFGLGQASKEISNNREYNLMLGLAISSFLISQGVMLMADLAQKYFDPKSKVFQ